MGLKECIEFSNSVSGEHLFFNPPQMFLQLKLVDSIEFDEDGTISTVNSIGPSFLYLNTPEVEKLLSANEPEFTL